MTACTEDKGERKVGVHRTDLVYPANVVQIDDLVRLELIHLLSW